MNKELFQYNICQLGWNFRIGYKTDGVKNGVKDGASVINLFLANKFPTDASRVDKKHLFK